MRRRPAEIKKQRTNYLEKIVLVVAIIEPLSAIPQLYELYTTKDASSLSLTTWVLFDLASFIWLYYGIKIKSAPLIASSILWIVTEVLLIIGIILYS